MYWLFQLGTALQLTLPVVKKGMRGFEVKLTSADALSDINSWKDLPQRYQMLHDKT